jgi:putative flippase GtrA
MRRLVPSRFVRFVLVSAFAAGMNILARIVLSAWLAYPAAICGAFVVGLGTAFALNRWLVFDAGSDKLEVQALWFTLVNLAALAQTLAVSLVLARWALPMLGVVRGTEAIAHAIGVAVPVLTSYAGHKRLSFRR